jgi:hypothetical protein
MSRTSASTAVINFIHDEKIVAFDPADFRFSPKDKEDLVEGLQNAVDQYSLTAYWLATMRKRKNDAERERDEYRAKLYHHLKVEGGYAEKYRGARPTEDGLNAAILDDKTYRQLSANYDRIGEIVDHLWGLQKTVERKYEAIKETCSLIRSNRHAEAREEHMAQNV